MSRIRVLSPTLFEKDAQKVCQSVSFAENVGIWSFYNNCVNLFFATFGVIENCLLRRASNRSVSAFFFLSCCLFFTTLSPLTFYVVVYPDVPCLPDLFYPDIPCLPDALLSSSAIRNSANYRLLEEYTKEESAICFALIRHLHPIRQS